MMACNIHILSALVVLLVAVALPATTARPDDLKKNYKIPEEDGYGPFYGKIIGNLFEGQTETEKEWVLAYLYRDESCVPPEFDLNQFFAISYISEVFACQLLVEGIAVYNDEPDLATPPKQYWLQNAKDTTIPTVFVPRDEFDAIAASDGGATWPALLNAPNALRGEADDHTEVLHPPGNGAQVYRATYTSRGTLLDGRSFAWKVNVMFQDDNTQQNVALYTVDFK